MKKFKCPYCDNVDYYSDEELVDKLSDGEENPFLNHIKAKGYPCKCRMISYDLFMQSVESITEPKNIDKNLLDNLFAEGIRYLNNKEYKEAVAKFESMRDIDKDDWRGIFYYSFANQKLKPTSQVLARFSFLCRSFDDALREVDNNGNIDTATAEQLKIMTTLVTERIVELYKLLHTDEDKALSFLATVAIMGTAIYNFNELPIVKQQSLPILLLYVDMEKALFASIGFSLTESELEDELKIIRTYMPNYESGLPKGNSGGTKQGCYVATCVYNSYDCPEVWRLRRYRDNYLDKHWWGRLFIKIYYFISPTTVKVFGHSKWFKKIFKKYLDAKIKKLEKEGYESTPYDDKY